MVGCIVQDFVMVVLEGQLEVLSFLVAFFEVEPVSIQVIVEVSTAGSSLVQGLNCCLQAFDFDIALS